MNQSILKTLGSVSIILLATNSFAASGSMGTKHEISAAQGGSSPSDISALFQNPAGLSYNSKFAIDLMGFSNSTSFNPLQAGVGVYSGNGMFGFGLAATATPSNFSNTTSLKGGLGYSFGGRFALGVSGSYATTGGAFDATIGALINSHHAFRVGLAAIGVLNGIDAYGLGLAFDLNQNATIVFDATSNPGFTNINGDPALLINLNMFQLTGGYAFALRGSPGGTGAHGGLGVKFSEKLALHGYYAQLNQIWFDLKISL
jgi:hypothetical protein